MIKVFINQSPKNGYFKFLSISSSIKEVKQQIKEEDLNEDEYFFICNGNYFSKIY